jgi:hypothetical protein
MTLIIPSGKSVALALSGLFAPLKFDRPGSQE